MQMSTDDSSLETSRWGGILLGIAVVLGGLAVAEFGARLFYKNFGNPASDGLIHRPLLAEGAAPDPDPPFITNAEGFYTARPGTPGVNALGFRGITPEEAAATPGAVLLLGDRQAYGELAAPELTFTAQMAAKGHNLINLAMPGAGVRQYRALAEKYVPVVKPERVIVFFSTSDDFELDPPVRPGLERNYWIDGRPVLAASPEGAPYTPEEAIRAANAAAAPVPAPLRWLRKSALGAMLAHALDFPDDARRVGPVLEDLTAIQDLAAQHGAVFQVVLAPRPGESGETALARAEQSLGLLAPLLLPPFAPEDYADPDRALPNEAGHQKLARAFESILKDESPLTEGDAMFEGPLTLEIVCAELELRGDECQRAVDLFDSSNDDLAQLIFEPAEGAPSPGEFAVGSALLHRDISNFGADLQAYIASHIHAASGLYYLDVIKDMNLQRITRFEESLPEAVRPKLSLMRHLDLGTIDTGYRPVAGRISEQVEEIQRQRDAASKTEAAKISFDNFASQLQLSPEQAAKAREVLLQLRQNFADVLAHPAQGAPSPLQQVADKVAAGVPLDQAASVLAESMNAREAASGKTYYELYLDNELKLLPVLGNILTPEQIGLYSRLPVASLQAVDLGVDPLQNALSRIVSGAADDPDDPALWKNIRTRLNLTEKQAADALRVINGLKDRIANILATKDAAGISPVDAFHKGLAEGAPTAQQRMLEHAGKAVDPATGKTLTTAMEEAEKAAMRAIYRLLTPAQHAAYQEVVQRPLSQIKTGHDPLAEAIQRAKP